MSDKWRVEVVTQDQQIMDLQATLEASQASEARLREALTSIATHDRFMTGAADMMEIAQDALNATELNPITAVVEAARAIKVDTYSTGEPFVSVHREPIEALARAIAALDNTGGGQ